MALFQKTSPLKGKQGPSRHKTLNAFWAYFATCFRKLHSPGGDDVCLARDLRDIVAGCLDHRLRAVHSAAPSAYLGPEVGTHFVK